MDGGGVCLQTWVYQACSSRIMSAASAIAIEDICWLGDVAVLLIFASHLVYVSVNWKLMSD